MVAHQFAYLSWTFFFFEFPSHGPHAASGRSEVVEGMPLFAEPKRTRQLTGEVWQRTVARVLIL